MLSIDDLKARLSLRGVLSSVGSTEDQPGFFKCPMHPNQATGSFHLRDNDSRWHCFSCGNGGDVLDLMAKMRGLSLAETIKALRDENDPHWTSATSMPVVQIPIAPQHPVYGHQRIDPAAFWGRCAANAKEPMNPSSTACAFLRRRFGDLSAAKLLGGGHVGLVRTETEPERWIRMRAADGYGIAIPLYGVPDPEEKNNKAEPIDVALRWCDVGPRPEAGRKILRLPRAASGRTVFFGWISDAMTAAESGDLFIVEGWADYLSLRCETGAVLGIQSCSTARKSSVLIDAEIQVRRALGLDGPKRVVLCAQNDEPSREGMKVIADKVRHLVETHIVEATKP